LLLLLLPGLPVDGMLQAPGLLVLPLGLLLQARPQLLRLLLLLKVC
jgi:hypothetical protein